MGSSSALYVYSQQALGWPDIQKDYLAVLCLAR